MRLSIVVPTRNRPEDLARALASIMPQMRDCDELLIIDQSFVSSAARVNDLVKRTQVLGTVVYDYCPDSINSLVQAKAYSVEKASGELVVFLEDDIEICEDYLPSVRKIFLENPDLIGGCGVEIGKTPSFMYRIGFKVTHIGLFDDQRVHVVPSRSGLEPVNSKFLSGGMSFFRTFAVRKVGFDLTNDLFALEDIDFSMRVSLAFGDNNLAIFPNIQLVHHRSNVNRLRGENRWNRKICEYVIFYKKFRRSLSDDLAFVWLALCLSVCAIIESIVMRDPKIVKGLFAGLFVGLRSNVTNISKNMCSN